MTSAKKKQEVQRKYDAAFILGCQMEDGNIIIKKKQNLQFSFRAHSPLKTCKKEEKGKKGGKIQW